jgi:hypothetical protein
LFPKENAVYARKYLCVADDKLAVASVCGLASKLLKVVDSRKERSHKVAWVVCIGVLVKKRFKRFSKGWDHFKVSYGGAGASLRVD